MSHKHERIQNVLFVLGRTRLFGSRPGLMVWAGSVFRPLAISELRVVEPTTARLRTFPAVIPGEWEVGYSSLGDKPGDERHLRRFGEISQLKWSQVDFDGRAVRLRNDQTKAKEPRVIPLGGPGNDLHDMLLEQQKRRNALCPDSPWVFFRQGSINPNKESARRGRQVQDIRKAWAAAVKETEINRLFHDLRRTGVRNLVRAGVPEKVAMLISGHKTRSVFERYNIVDERDLHDAAEKLYRHLSSSGEHPNVEAKSE